MTEVLLRHRVLYNLTLAGRSKLSGYLYNHENDPTTGRGEVVDLRATRKSTGCP